MTSILWIIASTCIWVIIGYQIGTISHLKGEKKRTKALVDEISTAWKEAATEGAEKAFQCGMRTGYARGLHHMPFDEHTLFGDNTHPENVS